YGLRETLFLSAFWRSAKKLSSARKFWTVSLENEAFNGKGLDNSPCNVTDIPAKFDARHYEATPQSQTSTALSGIKPEPRKIEDAKVIIGKIFREQRRNLIDAK
ncbi:MAG: hypothetical protein NZM05_12700, partial [Chloroherpetonaceae bacterium]|nr:hypothetical protein [Chloroherpetonaceae bacterium]